MDQVTTVMQVLGGGLGRKRIRLSLFEFRWWRVEWIGGAVG